jgi:hypothetical protein
MGLRRQGAEGAKLGAGIIGLRAGSPNSGELGVLAVQLPLGGVLAEHRRRGGNGFLCATGRDGCELDQLPPSHAVPAGSTPGQPST